MSMTMIVSLCIAALIGRGCVRLCADERLARLWQTIPGVQRRRDRRIRQRIAEDAPLVADLVALGCGAGCTPPHALELATQWGPEQAVAPLRRVQERVMQGATFAQALGELAQDAPAYAALASALLAAHHGSPVHALITRITTEARADVRRRGEARARRLPVLLLFPLIFLVLPAFVICSVAPLIAGYFSEFA